MTGPSDDGQAGVAEEREARERAFLAAYDSTLDDPMAPAPVPAPRYRVVETPRFSWQLRGIRSRAEAKQDRADLSHWPVATRTQLRNLRRALGGAL